MDGLYPVMGTMSGSTPTISNTRTAPEYLNAWWNVVNWDEVARRYKQARSGR